MQSWLFIDGKPQAPSSGRFYDVCNPADPDEVVGQAALASREDARLAIEAAARAWPAWQALSYEERAGYMNRLGDRLGADRDDLEARIRLFTREHGKILKESRIEMTRLDGRFRYRASLAGRLAKDERLPGPPFDTLITKQARGVAALIVPWNVPLAILGGKLPQALMAGNTVVIKIASRAPLAPSQTIALMAAALPPGVINLVNGSPADVGDELLTHPLVRKVNFTGSTAAGKAVMRTAASTLKHLTLELGGNDPAIILDDALIDEAAIRRLVGASFSTTGQICMAIKRIYVHQSLYTRVVEGFIDVASEYIVGNGLDDEVTMGPLNNREQLEVVQRLVADARARHALVREVGRYREPGAAARGYFHLPTVVTGIDPGAPVVSEEQFGPVMPIVPFETEEEAIRMANDTEFGLCSSVWTQDRDRALRVARRLEAGCTYLNAHGPVAHDNRAPFGGVKQSGIGRNLGYEGMLEFMEYHSVCAPEGWLF